MTNYEKLEKVLTELFQLDKAELDFGIYRIMNQKRDDVLDFLKNTLPKEVRTILEGQKQGDAISLKKELDNAIKTAKEFGAPDPENTDGVKAARAAYESAGSIDGLEQEVFSHLASFFKRYYEGGDFISLRRYKKDVYAIPYEGEEVKLHWANHDQYYIKTSENLKNYAFKIDGDKTVKFTLKEANTEQNNNKTQNDQERRFALYEEEPVTIDGKTIHLNFTYEPHKKTVKQDKLLQTAIEQLTEKVPAAFTQIFSLAPTEKNKKRTLLEKHLNDFSARNTFDYFIHKDLGGFLTRELDFYIKNEVLFIDDINTDNEQAFTTQLSKIRALKQVAGKIITFLAQLENFQKKLWLKKKFVISCDYCITLDRIPEKYYKEISENRAQLEEWKELFKINEIQSDLLTIKYSEPLSIEFLKSQSFLVLDTKFFSQEFKDTLLAEFDDLDKQTNGVLINSENFQANQLLLEKFKNNVDCIYLDPPYNTTENAFLYKNNYKHSSWLSLMSNGIRLAPTMLSENGALITAIDDTETARLRFLLEDIFGSNNFLGTIAAEINPAGQNIRSNAPSRSHDYFHIFSKDIDKIKMQLRGLTKEEVAAFKLVDNKSRFNWDNLRRRGGNSRPTDRPKQWFPIYYSEGGGLRVPKMDWNEKNKQWKILEEVKDNEKEIYPIDPKGEKRIWRTNPDGARRDINLGEIDVIEKANRLVISKKSRIPEGKKPKTMWYDSKYSGTSHGTKLLIKLFGPKATFSYPKSIHLTQDAIRYWVKPDSYVFDYFAGSGTTGHAVVNLNREDNGNRKFMLVEMGAYFNSATKPRLLKSIFSSNWSNGSPLEGKGLSSLVKYHNLESYEDALNNLQLKPNQAQQQLLDTNSNMQEEYLLQYMLDVESRDQLLNIEAFKNPFNYKLNITENNELVPTNVDLVETFNYLIGLHVKRVQRSGAFKTVEGITNAGDKVLVIWRNLEESNNDDLNTFVKKLDYNLRDGEFDTIYVNGDNNLANLRQDEETWKVLLLEEVFFTAMFDVKDI